MRKIICLAGVMMFIGLINTAIEEASIKNADLITVKIGVIIIVLVGMFIEKEPVITKDVPMVLVIQALI